MNMGLVHLGGYPADKPRSVTTALARECFDRGFNAQPASGRGPFFFALHAVIHSALGLAEFVALAMED
jgi:hypothetical protein